MVVKRTSSVNLQALSGVGSVDWTPDKGAYAVLCALFLSRFGLIIKVPKVPETNCRSGGEYEVYRVRKIPALLPREHPPHRQQDQQQSGHFSQAVEHVLEPPLPDLFGADDPTKRFAIHFMFVWDGVFDLQQQRERLLTFVSACMATGEVSTGTAECVGRVSACFIF